MKALANAAVECRGDHSLCIGPQLDAHLLNVREHMFRFHLLPVARKKTFEFILEDGVQLVLLSVVRDRIQTTVPESLLIDTLLVGIIAKAVLPALEVAEQNKLCKSSPDEGYSLQASGVGLDTLAQIAAHADAIHSTLYSRVLGGLLALLPLGHIGARCSSLSAT